MALEAADLVRPSLTKMVRMIRTLGIKTRRFYLGFVKENNIKELAQMTMENHPASKADLVVGHDFGGVRYRQIPQPLDEDVIIDETTCVFFIVCLFEKIYI